MKITIVSVISIALAVSFSLPAPASADTNSFQCGDQIKTLVKLNIRKTPSTSATIAAKAPVGSTGVVTCDATPVPPTVSGGLTWWYIKWDSSSLSPGWSADGASEASFLAKVSSAATFQEGDRVQAAVALKIRGTPSTSGTLLDQTASGSLGTIRCNSAPSGSTCPTDTNGYTWWYISWDGSLSAGWSAEGNSEANFLNKETSLTLSITTASLASATVGTYYSGGSISATGGTDSYSWSITSGSLPPGLSLITAFCAAASTCQAPVGIGGTPTTVGTYKFTMTVTAGTQSASKSFTIIVSSATSTTACTKELKLCSDGKTYVGRTGLSCAFASCPVTTASTTGYAYAKATLDGVEISGTRIYINSKRPYGPETNVPIGPPGGGTVLTGDYTYTYVSGGPTNSTFKNISATINSATGPTSLTQTLATGGTITFYYNFVSKTVAVTSTTTTSAKAPTITSISPISGPTGTIVTVTGTGFTSTGNNISFNYYPNTITSLASSDTTTLTFIVPKELCTYYTWNCSAFVPATYQITVVNANGTSLGKSFTVTSDTSSSSTTGTIVWAATLDGVAWTGSIVVNGVTPVDSPQNINVPTATYPGAPTGNYTYTYVSGGPANSTFKNISNYANKYSTGPTTLTQPLYSGGTITFYYNFVSK